MSLTGLMPFSLCSCETHQTQTTQISGTVSYESHPIGSRLLGWQEGGKIIRIPHISGNTYKHSQTLVYAPTRHL